MDGIGMPGEEPSMDEEDEEEEDLL